MARNGILESAIFLVMICINCGKRKICNLGASINSDTGKMEKQISWFIL